MRLSIFMGVLIGFVGFLERAQVHIADSVEVSGTKVVLSEIARIEGQDTSLCEQLRAIELGVSPVPGQKRAFTRQQLITRLRQHQIPLQHVSIVMPDKISILRRFQTMESSRVTAFAMKQLEAVLGEKAADWTLQSAPNLLPLPEGEVELRLDTRPQIGRDQARVAILIVQGDKILQRVSLLFNAPARSHATLIKTGAQVMVRAVSGEVVITTIGTARGSGAAGDEIMVFLTETKKSVKAVVLDEENVEIKL